MFPKIGMKNNKTSVSDADREIPTLGSMDNARNEVNLVSGINRLPSGWDFSVCIGNRRLILFFFNSKMSTKRQNHKEPRRQTEKRRTNSNHIVITDSYILIDVNMQRKDILQHERRKCVTINIRYGLDET